MRQRWVALLIMSVLCTAAVSAEFRKNIRFEYDPARDARLSAAEVRIVSVAGTFNGWNKSANPLARQADGTWSADIPLGLGTHYYKLVINGETWLEDLYADTALRKDDGTGHGACNSGVHVIESGGDYGDVVSGGIRRAALKHDPSSGDVIVVSPGRLRIGMRTRAGDATSVEIAYDDAGTARRFGMKKMTTTDEFDRYEAMFDLKGASAYIDYRFLVHDGDAVETFAPPGRDFMAFTGRLRDVPDWAQDAVWYQVFPERFRNGDPKNDPDVAHINEGDIPGWKVRAWGSDWYAMDEWEKKNFPNVFQSIFRRRYGGDLQGVIDKLDYIQSLGVTAIYLNPIFRSPSLHKYDGTAFHHIEETFGPDPDGDRRMIESANETEDPATWVWTSADKLFLALVKEVHRRNMRVIIDGVFNHSGRTFFAFQDLLKNREASRYTSWYGITRWDASLADGFDYNGWYGMKYLPEFRRDENGVDSSYQKYVFDITRRWMSPEGRIDAGVDGWRLDVAFCLPHGFWKQWRRHVKSINPAAYITGEVVEIAPDFLRGDEFDGLMNYPFAYTAVEFFADRKTRIAPTEFDRRLGELRDAYPAEITRVMQNLYSSHDSARTASLIVNPDMNYRDFGGHFNRSKVEQTPSYRIDRGGADERATHRLMVTFQMTYVGAPMVYYGNEIGMSGANDPDCRKPMIWDDIKYEDEAVHPCTGYIRLREPSRADAGLLEHYRKMIRIRRENASLRRGSYETVLADDERGLFGFARVHGSERVLVVFNAGAEVRAVQLAAAQPDGTKYRSLHGRPGDVTVQDGQIRFMVPPREAVILRVDVP